MLIMGSSWPTSGQNLGEKSLLAARLIQAIIKLE
jgi:hypothetical protein